MRIFLIHVTGNSNGQASFSAYPQTEKDETEKDAIKILNQAKELLFEGESKKKYDCKIIDSPYKSTRNKEGIEADEKNSFYIQFKQNSDADIYFKMVQKKFWQKKYEIHKG